MTMDEEELSSWSGVYEDIIYKKEITKMANTDPSRIVTGEVRLSYVYLLKPRPNNFGGEPKYSVTVLVPKSDTATVGAINAAVEAAKQKGKNDKWNGVIPPAVRTPVHDGDGVRQSDGQPYGPECKGHLVINATCGADRPPKIVNLQLDPIMDATEIYSGMYGRIAIRFAPYSNSGNKGVGAYIDTNVQKTRDGEPLGAVAPDASQDFGGPAPAQPQPQTNYIQTPPATYQQPQSQPQQGQHFDPLTGTYR